MKRTTVTHVTLCKKQRSKISEGHVDQGRADSLSEESHNRLCVEVLCCRVVLFVLRPKEANPSTSQARNRLRRGLGIDLTGLKGQDMLAQGK